MAVAVPIVPTLRPLYAAPKLCAASLKHPQALRRADRLDALVVGRLAEQVDGDDPDRSSDPSLGRRDRRLRGSPGRG